MKKAKNGKLALLYNQSLGVVAIGDGIAVLADNAWFRVDKKAASGSALPYDTGYKFKSPDSGNAITPVVGDDVFPITLERMCKAEASVSSETGVIETTDDCSNGYIENITDGFTAQSGDVSAFMKFDDVDGDLVPGQEAIMNRFFDIQEDDGAGAYTLTPKIDTDFQLAILQNSDQTAEGFIQNWLLIPVILSSLTTDKPLKGSQNLDFSWSKGEGPSALYKRTINSEEAA